MFQNKDENNMNPQAQNEGEYFISYSEEKDDKPEKMVTEEQFGEDLMAMIFSSDDKVVSPEQEADTDALIPEKSEDEVWDDAVGIPEEVLEAERKRREEGNNVFKKVYRYLLPVKGDSAKEVVRKCVFLVALTVFIISAVYLINYFRQGGINNALLDDAREIYSVEDDSYNEKGMLTRFEELYKKNDEIVGWLTIDGTKIDYPVYQAEDNDFYIDHDMSKQESRYGAVFADCYAKIGKSGNSKNLVLYGHNMIDGSMFSQLLEYKNLDFYRANPLVSFDTIYNEGAYKVFAVFIINADKKDDDGYVFNYRKNSFAPGTSFKKFIAEVEARSIIKTDVDVKDGDDILTLSTCSYEFDNARTVVMARKVRDTESLYVNVKKAKVNKTPLYPQAYYDKFGGEKPDIDLELNPSEGEQETLEGFAQSEERIYTTSDILSEEELGEAPSVKVGKYVGMDLNSAIYQIAMDGFYVVDIEYEGSGAEKNEVTYQSLKNGSMAKEGTGITLKVTGSAVSLPVPKIVGMNIEEAKEYAANKGFSVNAVMVASDMPKGTVVMQSIAPDTMTETRSMVVYVSFGTNRMPDLSGMKIKKAKALVEEKGFECTIVYIETVNDKQIDVVCDQSVEPLTFCSKGTEVKLYVGKKATSSAVDEPQYIETETEWEEEENTPEEEETSSKDTPSKGTSSKEKDKDTSSKKNNSQVASSAASSTTSATSSEVSSTSSTVSSTVSSVESTPEVNSSEVVSSEEPKEEAPSSTPSDVKEPTESSEPQETPNDSE